MSAATIPVVDDDRAVREALRRVLLLNGYAVEQVASAQEALTRVAAVPLDARVLDVGLPGIDGLEVARRPRGAGIRLLSARPQCRPSAAFRAAASAVIRSAGRVETTVNAYRREFEPESQLPPAGDRR